METDAKDIFFLLSLVDGSGRDDDVAGQGELRQAG